ncbi:lamin tail domain-containing protein [Streptomyces sp. NPDC050610]|uniref:lamin tail domain-containing protein n=1 Tax=Streptomyces sp. NPDC050610 TaxID=3157097 RepID=UPI00342BF495
MIRFAPRLATAVLGSAALAAALALPASATGHHTPGKHHSPIVLGAVQADSPGHDDHSNRSLNAEWVTVKNTGNRPVDLKGWTLTSDCTHKVYHFRHLNLGGHKSVRVHTGRGHDTARDVFQNSREYAWDDHRDTATLRNAHHHTVDTKHWGHPHHNHHSHR